MLHSKFLRQSLCSHYLLWKSTVKYFEMMLYPQNVWFESTGLLHTSCCSRNKEKKKKRKRNVLLWKNSPDCCLLKAWIFVQLVPFLKFTYRVWGCFKVISIFQYCGSVNFLIFSVLIAFALLCLSCPKMLRNPARTSKSIIHNK